MRDGGLCLARHIAHLDLKPDNVLLHEDGRLVFSDFGLAYLIKEGRTAAKQAETLRTAMIHDLESARGKGRIVMKVRYQS